MTRAPDYLVVGLIVRAHGIRGEILVEKFTDHDERFDIGRTLWLGRTPDDDGRIEVVVKASRTHKGRSLIAIDRIEDRTAAERHKGWYLSIPREIAEEARQEGEYFLHELRGLEARTVDGDVMGVVAEVMELADRVFLEIRAEGSKPKLLPYTPFVKAVENDHVVLDPPAGWSEL